MSRSLCILAAGVAISLASCGGGGTGQTDYVSNASPGGIWSGTDAVTGLALLGLIDELGEFTVIRADGVQFTGMALTAGNALTATVEGSTAFGRTFPDGSTHGTGTFNGTVQARQSIDGDANFTTDGGTGTNVLGSLTFRSAYFEASSLNIIAGIYTDAGTGIVVVVSSNGEVFAQDAADGCVINGTVSIIESTYNMYRVQVSYASCQGAAAALNGIAFSGLAALDDTASPQGVIAGVTGHSGAAHYALTYTLIRSSPPPF
ncbi:MAG: hypothetical protein PVSMB6_04150 [Steroidobacteraceae bacterium]